MVKKKESARDRLDDKLTRGEKKLLKEVLRKKSIAVRKKIKGHGTTYKKELKKALLTAFVAAFGFLMALEWREVVREFVDGLLSFSPIQTRLISAIVITLVSVSGILIFTKILREEE